MKYYGIDRNNEYLLLCSCATNVDFKPIHACILSICWFVVQRNRRI